MNPWFDNVCYNKYANNGLLNPSRDFQGDTVNSSRDFQSD
jgi:hypothetical protein